MRIYGFTTVHNARPATVSRHISKSLSLRFSTGYKKSECSDLFEYTTGRWMYNDALRRRERRRAFNVFELKRLAALSVQQREEDVARLEKLAEGGFNRSFLVTMRNGFRIVARIPYPVTEPKRLLITSEVATMDFLRSQGIPVPKVFGYSTHANNPAKTEYIFMEFVQGVNLGKIWFILTEKERTELVANIVQLESRLFALQFPAAGSIYYGADLPDQTSRVPLFDQDSQGDGNFCIGPDMSVELWYGKRARLSVYRGPYTENLSVLTAGAQKEIAYLRKFGRDVQPLQRLRRETFNYQVQSHIEHIDSLQKYLQIASHLIPHKSDLHRPIIRHPDLQPNNIFVSDKLEITGLIDWQNSAVLPRFLQCGIPNSIQNYGDDVSESLQIPTLPSNFDDLEEIEKDEQAEIFRRRQIHYLYIKMTAKMNPDHYSALAYNFSALRRRLFRHSTEPWEGDTVTLKADLVNLLKAMNGKTTVSCPIHFTDDESAEILRLESEQSEADDQLRACQEMVGVGTDGWAPAEQYDEARQRERNLKARVLEAAETDEERARLQEHWIFDDFCEEDYI